MMIVTYLCAIACGVLVAAEYFEKRMLRVVAKCAASGAFVIAGAHAWSHTDAAHAGYGAAILAGLALGAIGDIALLGKSDRSFLTGLVAFLAGHLAYVIAFVIVTTPSTWIGRGTLGTIWMSLLLLRWLWPHIGRMRGPVIAYIVVVTTMLIGALAAARNLPSPRDELVGFGGLCFYLSDITVAREKFVARSFSNKLIGLPLYFAGQLLIAWSVCA